MEITLAVGLLISAITTDKFSTTLFHFVELEEKDDVHLKCPDDTTSIGSNSVSRILLLRRELLDSSLGLVPRRERSEHLAYSHQPRRRTTRQFHFEQQTRSVYHRSATIGFQQWYGERLLSLSLSWE